MTRLRTGFAHLHPAVLESISRTLQAARDAGIPTIVCGEMASTPAYGVVLLGLGAYRFEHDSRRDSARQSSALRY